MEKLNGARAPNPAYLRRGDLFIYIKKTAQKNNPLLIAKPVKLNTSVWPQFRFEVSGQAPDSLIIKRFCFWGRHRSKQKRQLSK